MPVDSRPLVAGAYRNVTLGTFADLRFALRQCRRQPFVTAAMVLVLAIGLGSSTATFVLISSFNSAPLAAVDAQTVRVRGIDQSRGPGRAQGREFPYAEVLAYAAREDVFATLGAWTSTDAVLDLNAAGDGSPDLHSGAVTFVTAAYFRALGVQPVRGAGLPESFADDADPQTIGIISDVIWDRFFDRSDAVIGRTIKVNNIVITIAGVAPRRFVGARSGGSAMRVWLPMNTRPMVWPSGPALRGESAMFGIVARLGDAVTPDHASTVVSTVARRFATERHTTDVVPLMASNYFPPSGEPSSGAGPSMSLVMPLMILLISCTSVSALLAGQALSRRQEIAIRLAMGAHRRRIVRQLLTETALLGLFAGVLALCVLWWLLAGADSVLFGTGASLVLDWRAVTFTAVLALVASIAFGLSPAVHATRTTVSDVLKEGDAAPRRTRLQATLVIAQIALTQPALLVMGTLLLELRTDVRELAPMTLAADRLVEVGFNTNPRYGALDAAREDAIARVRARIVALPGVAGAVQQYGGGGQERVMPHEGDRVVGVPDVLDDAVVVEEAPEGYFGAMGLTVVEGREFAGTEQGARDLAVVNRELVRRFWGETSAIGRRVRVRHDDPRAARTLTVIGVVDEEGAPRLYEPARGGTTSHLMVRTHGLADETLPAIRAAALSAAPDVPITMARTRASTEAEDRREVWQAVVATGASAAVALLLSAIGLYAVVSVAVEQRRREIAVRAALGADRRALTTVFVAQGLRISAAGAVLGLLMSAVAYRVLAEAEMLGQSSDGSVGGTVAVLVTVFVFAVALVASWIPARRAAAVDPWSVLRAE